jgi:hypothetical protein
MRRIESTLVPAETRRMLRERFSRFLPTNVASTGRLDGPIRPLVSDVEVLDLFLHLEFTPGDDLSRARRLYEQASQPQIERSPDSGPRQADEAETSRDTPSAPSTHQPVLAPDEDSGEAAASAVESNSIHVPRDRVESAAPIVSVRIISDSPSLQGLSSPRSFDELLALGWIRASWGRFAVPRDVMVAVLRSPKSAGTAFRQLIEECDRGVFSLKNGFNPSNTLREIANGVVTQQYLPNQIACVSQAWIAARLWDTNPSGSHDLSAEERLGQWIDRWQFLNHPQFSISSHLARTSAEELSDISIGVLTDSSTMPDWEEFRDVVVAPRLLLYPHRALTAKSTCLAIPATAVGRLQWMTERDTQGAFHEYLYTRGASVMSVLLNELKLATADSLGLAPRLMEITLGRPVLFQLLVLTVRHAPVLLADMLIAPSTCALACSIIASWEFNGGGWNREFQAHANSATELFAFEDAIALLGGHLDAGRVHSSELAALYLNIYDPASTRRANSQRYTMLSLLREEIAAVGTGIQDEVVAALIESTPASPEPMVVLCATLDLVSTGGCVDRIDPSEIVSLYLDVVLPRGERREFPMWDTPIAGTFVALALRCSESLRTRFLRAIDVAAWLQNAPPSTGEDYNIYRDLLTRRIRLHIRVVSRAIAEWPTEVPNDLSESLGDSIHAGALDHVDRGRIDAFAQRIGSGNPWSTEERPLALDLAAALRKLHGAALQRLLTEICQLEEPVVLAGIVANTPAIINEQIKARLQSLTPATSSKVRSLPALQARVAALLNAGMPDAAEVFLTAERNAETLGTVLSREVLALREDLQLLLLRKGWSEIASYTLPEGTSEQSKREANEVLLFYRGLAELGNPDGNPETAETIFMGLAERHRGVTAYPLNLFASRVHRLLAGDVFQVLSGEELREAKFYLSESRRITRPLIQHSVSDLKSLDMNRAMLLLAANQPGEGLQVLLILRETYFDEHIEGFRALALARLGSKREALAVLTQSERIFGRSDFLSAVRANLDTHLPYMTAPSLSLDDDPVPGIRQAFEAFSRLSHVEQAEVLQSRGRLDLYLLEEIRGACASLVALAPMMRELGMVRYEDDISGVLKQILRSRLLLPQWSVEDQPRGGFSSSGGVGERDIVVSKGTATLAVIEALTTDFVETGNLTSHFKKLLGYDTCRFFFHITYARRSNCGGILDHLRGASALPPAGFNYLRSENLADSDSMPVGFKAYYEIDSRSIVVVFLAVEIGQPVQRAAAAGQ